jgi:hypothetical protein
MHIRLMATWTRGVASPKMAATSEQAVAGVGYEHGNRESEARLAGYEPTRPSRLRGATEEPPPLPPLPDDDAEGFGNAGEDGLRMLAALETLTSLEPDYSDDLTAEASVTIIETAGYDVVAEALARDPADGRSLRALLQGRDEPPRLLLNGYETFGGTGEEATVEIVEVVHDFEAPETTARKPTANPTSLAERIAAATGRGAAGGRFFKALSGGE